MSATETRAGATFPDNALAFLLRRDRLLITAGILLVALLAWIWLLLGAGMEMSAIEMTRMAAHHPAPHAHARPWSPAYALLMFTMWWVMMIAMMMPSAAPVILLAAALNRRADPARPPFGRSGFFVAGYLGVWGLFSAAATAMQWALSEWGYLSGLMQTNDNLPAGTLLVAAGAWQLTPAKRACLRHCRSPVQYLTERRRAGGAGSLVMGAGHGAYCVGCCWALMVLLFVGGVMNIYWIAGLGIFVLAEKGLPIGENLGRAAGAALVAGGIAVAAGII